MANQVHACVSCGEAFASTQDAALHWAATHDKGFVPRGGQRLKRPTTCQRCASEIPAGVMSCVCGFTHQPTKGDNQ